MPAVCPEPPCVTGFKVLSTELNFSWRTKLLHAERAEVKTGKVG